MRRCTVFMLVTVLVVSCLFVHVVMPVSAQAGYKPSVPQFSVQLVDSSYDVPPSSTTTVDQYTGKETTTTIPGYHVNQVSIEVSIKNQPFTSYTGENNTWLYGPNGQVFNLYYIVHVKGHFGEDWKNFVNSYDIYDQYPTIQSDSGYTIVSAVVNYAADAQLDFRVKAVIGYMFNEAYNSPLIPPQYAIRFDVQSDWSNVQKFIVPDGPSASASPSKTATFPPVTSDGNGQPQFPHQTQPSNNSLFTSSLFMLVIGVILGGVVVATVVLIFRRQPKNSTQTNTYTVLSSKLFSFLSILLVRCGW